MNSLQNIVTCMIVLSLLTPACLARDFTTIDGQFTVCKFREFKNCDLLTQSILKSDRFSDGERRTIRKLDAFVHSNYFTGNDLVKAFGKPNMVAQPPDEDVGGKALIFGWLDEPKGNCSLCGIRMVLINEKLLTADFVVNKKFMVHWAQKASPKPPLR